MLEIDVSLEEGYDEEANKFVASKSHRVNLEHSLVSVSKWESVWEEPFLGKKEKSNKQVISYVQMMILDEIPPEVFHKLITDHLTEIIEYIKAPMTATTISESKGSPGYREIITSEVIYFWMVSMNIPSEYQFWHLNRLIMLIRVINAKNAPKKRMTAAERQQLNRQRLQKHNTRG